MGSDHMKRDLPFFQEADKELPGHAQELAGLNCRQTRLALKDGYRTPGPQFCKEHGEEMNRCCSEAFPSCRPDRQVSLQQTAVHRRFQQASNPLPLKFDLCA
jgi:hypothetical protein